MLCVNFSVLCLDSLAFIGTICVCGEVLIVLIVLSDLGKGEEENAPPESRLELWHRAQTLHCGIHVTGVAKVGQATRQLHLQTVKKHFSNTHFSFILIDIPSISTEAV